MQTLVTDLGPNIDLRYGNLTQHRAQVQLRPIVELKDRQRSNTYQTQCKTQQQIRPNIELRYILDPMQISDREVQIRPNAVLKDKLDPTELNSRLDPSQNSDTVQIWPVIEIAEIQIILNINSDTDQTLCRSEKQIWAKCIQITAYNATVTYFAKYDTESPHFTHCKVT